MTDKLAAPAEYKVDDQEILLVVYKKLLWNRLVPKIPASIAPNTITIFGQIAALLAIVAALGAVAGTPILYLVSALLLLTYLTADNVDGPHARRTGQASPLGEFLDHGLDGIASGAVLITACIILRVDVVPMVLLCILGALGFILVFWEQFRTGLLVIPKVSSTEGVTLLMVIQLILCFAGDPTWLHFSMTEFNAGTAIVVVVLVGYAAAMAPPIVRASHAGAKPWELLPMILVGGSVVGFALLGAEALPAAAAVSIFGADIVCRMIVLRHRGERGPIMSPLHYLIAIPLIPALALPHTWSVTGWSTVSLVVAAALYTVTLYRGGSEMIGRHAHAV